MGGIIFFYLLLVKFSFVLAFESSNAKAELKEFASAHCDARILNDGAGRFLSRLPLSPVASSRSHLYPWFLQGVNMWESARALTALG